MEAIISVLLILGATFVALGSLGLAKLSHFLRRVHAPTKASTLGIGALLLGSSLYFGLLHGTGLAPNQLALIGFLFVTAPVSANLLVRAALALDPSLRPPPPGAAPLTSQTAATDRETP
jgi:multicomponent K+:H+ antiporter subunit G